LLARP